MSDYEASIQTMVEHLRDGDHAAAYVGTLEPTDDGSDFEVLAAVDTERVDTGEARVELLAHHLLVITELTGRTPSEIAAAIVNVIEHSQQFDSHTVEPADEEDR